MTKANTLPKRPPAIAKTPRLLAECYLRTTEEWGGSYYVCAFDPCNLPDRPPPEPKMLVRVTLYRHLSRELQRTDTPDTPGLWCYRLTAWGTDDLMLGRWFDTEQEATSALCVLMRRAPVTFALCAEMGMEP